MSKIIFGEGANQDIWGQRVVVTDESIDISQLLGEGVTGLPPKAYAYVRLTI